MSLNGLDANAVVEAHQSALSDPGGWFLLKYANRDTVDVLSRGNGGVAECKDAVEGYGEKSPLYGMLQYRRKRVLLKYMPEGMSRLLQVRTSVQFQSVLDAFPQDTVFTFTAAAELVESALGLCTMLQPTTAGPLQSSSSSLRQRRLNEISEDVEDFIMPVKKDEIIYTRQEPVAETFQPDNNSDISTLPASALRAKALLAKRKEENYAASLAGTMPVSYSMSPPTLDVDELPSRSMISEPPRPFSSLGHSVLSVRTEARSSTYRTQSNTIEQSLKQFHHSRHLSENESKNISQWNDQVAEYALPLPKPKKKLGPRPHVEPAARPKTAHLYEDSQSTRPVANLPQSVRMSNRANPHLSVRPGSQQSTRSVPARFLPTGNAPPLPDFTMPQSNFMRPESRKAGSVVSSAVTDVPTASPEKMRLMKALQNRKRNQILGQRAASAQPRFAPDRDDFPLGIAEIPKTIKEEPSQPPPMNKSANDSSTASPTSIGTTSDDPSTRPSSYTDDPKSRSSQESISNDTDSSSTPKAVAENVRDHARKHTSWFDSAPDLNSNSDLSVSAMPKMSLIDEELAHTNAPEAPKSHQAQPEADIPRNHDRSAMSWLASASEIDLVRNLVQAREPPSPVKADTPLASTNAITRPGPEESAESSDEDDGSLADELHTATVHEATPVSVSRPPLTPTMRTYSHDRSRATTKSTSTFSLSQSNTSTPNAREKSPGNSLNDFSTALPQWPSGSSELMAVSLTKKATLGHGISKRIKALEDSSRKDSSPPAQDASTSRSASSNFIKRMSFIPQNSNGPADKSRLAGVDTQAAANGLVSDRSKIESDGGATYSQPSGRPLLTLGHLETGQFPSPGFLQEPNGMLLETPSSPSSEKKRFSFASYRSGGSYRSGTTAKWMQPESMASLISLNKENKPSRATSEASSVNNEKRTSRTSRLMKRISGFGSRSNGKAQQQRSTVIDQLRPDPIMEQNESIDRQESAAESTMQMIDIGDMNVQFPETLLWKRRFLRIDDQGYLIFANPTEQQTTRTTSRKFHLGDIQEPCLPDLEREEMAWSVLLDLRDGNCIQCACGSKQTQAKVLRLLLDAHNAFHSLYPDALD